MLSYAADRYRQLLTQHGIQPSMSRTGTCWDNAVAESFFHTLKTELIYLEDFETHEHAQTCVSWIWAHKRSIQGADVRTIKELSSQGGWKAHKTVGTRVYAILIDILGDTCESNGHVPADHSP